MLPNARRTISSGFWSRPRHNVVRASSELWCWLLDYRHQLLAANIWYDGMSTVLVSFYIYEMSWIIWQELISEVWLNRATPLLTYALTCPPDPLTQLLIQCTDPPYFYYSHSPAHISLIHRSPHSFHPSVRARVRACVFVSGVGETAFRSRGTTFVHQIIFEVWLELTI